MEQPLQSHAVPDGGGWALQECTLEACAWWGTIMEHPRTASVRGAVRHSRYVVYTNYCEGWYGCGATLAVAQSQTLCGLLDVSSIPFSAETLVDAAALLTITRRRKQTAGPDDCYTGLVKQPIYRVQGTRAD